LSQKKNKRNRGKGRGKFIQEEKSNHVPFALRFDTTDTVVKSSSYKLSLRVRSTIEKFIKHLAGRNQLFEKVAGDRLFLRIENTVIFFRPPSSCNEMFHAFKIKPNKYYNKKNSNL